MLEAALKEFIKQTVLECIAECGTLAEPELITIEKTAKIIDCDVSVVHNLARSAASNGFPYIDLGPRTKRIDKTRLTAWLHAGGLKQAAGSVTEIGEWRKTA